MLLLCSIKITSALSTSPLLCSRRVPRATAAAASVAGVNVGGRGGLFPFPPRPPPLVARRPISAACFAHGRATRSTPPPSHPPLGTPPASRILHPPAAGAIAERTARRRLARMTMSSGGGGTADAHGGGIGDGSFPTIRGRTLVSVRDCLDATSAADDAAERKDEDVGGAGAGTADRPRIVFVDGSWYHRGGRNGRLEFEAGPRIRGARYVDMDDVAAQGGLFPDLNPKGLPHMMPPKHLFAAVMDALDIKNSDHVVVYGRDGCIFTPRTWFLFRAMGHDPGKIHLLQGSYEDWVAAGGAVETHPTTVIRARDLDFNLTEEAESEAGVTYKARDAKNVCDMDFVLNEVVGMDAHGSSQFTLLDSRGSSFGKGHIPGAIHVPYSSLVRRDNQLKFKAREELEALFQRAGVDVKSETPIVCSCGSGVSVCHLVVALEECGRAPDTTIIYDGSWTEWGADPESPKVMSS